MHSEKRRIETKVENAKFFESPFLKLVIFSVTLFTSLPLFAQVIKPFEDYSKCMTGFLNEKGDTVFPAQFESTSYCIHRDSYKNRDSTTWIVNFHGRYGYLDSKGAWIFKPEYSRLEMWGDNYFFVEKNTKCGILSAKGKFILPIEYDSINPYPWLSAGDQAVYLVKKNNLMGVCNARFELFIPMMYDSLFIYDYRVPGRNGRSKLFYVEGNNTSQMYDSLGKPLLPFNYKEIKPFYSTYDAIFSDNILFGVKNEKNQYSVVDSYGKELLPWSNNEFEPVTTGCDVLDERPASFVKQTFDKGMIQLTKLSSGVKSERFTSMNPLGDFLVLRTNEKWRIVDTNFKTVFNQPNPKTELCAFFGNGGGFGDTRYKRLDYFDLSMNDYYTMTYGESFVMPLVVVLENYGEKIGEHLQYGKTVTDYKKRFGLLHLKTKAQSPVKYDKIMNFGGGGKTFYWAVYPDTSSSSTDTSKLFLVDIYDTDIKLLRTISISETENNRLYYYSKDYTGGNITVFNRAELTVFRDTTLNQIRWIDGTKPPVADFEFPIVQLVLRKDSTGFVKIVDKSTGKFYIKSIQGTPSPFDGKEYISFTYNLYTSNSISSEKLTILETANDLTFVDNDFNIVLDSCSFMIPRGRNPEGYVEYVPARVTVVRKGWVYGFIKDRFVILDSTIFPHQSAKFWISDKGYVDKTGRFYEQKPPIFCGYYLGSISNDTLVLENRKKAEVLRFPNIKTVSDYDRAFLVTSTGNKVGLISSFDGSWLVNPQYDSIYHAGEFECFLVKDNKKNPEKWLLINQKGKRLTQPIFDTTFYFDEYIDFVYAKSNGKIGTFSTKSYKWMTKPMYDAKAFLSHELGMLFTKDDYVFVDWETGKSFGVEHDSVLFYVNDWYSKFVFIQDGMIEIRDIKGKKILPRTPIEEALANDDIIKFDSPKYSKGTIEYLKENPFQAENVKALRRRFKQIELETYRTYCHPKDSMFLYRYGLSPTYDNYCSREPLGYSTKLYSERIKGNCPGRDSTPCLENYEQVNYLNFRISNDSLIEIKQLSELFLPNSGWESRLDAQIAKAIQQDQIFGLSCTDIPAAIKQFKLNFTMIAEGLIFYTCDYQDFHLFVPLDEMKDCLRWPEMFGD